MIPQPGETAGTWWDNTGVVRARVAAARRGGYSVEFDLRTCSRRGLTRRAGTSARTSGNNLRGSLPVSAMPQIPIHVIASADDRFFPLEFQRGVARARLDKNVDIVPGGHLVALTHPEELVEVLLRYEREV